jgi:large subunit ribosomal protein L21
MAYAIVKAGGKQLRVEPGQVVDVELLDAAPGDTVEFNEVLLLATEDSVQYGKPTVDGAKVVGQVMANVKGRKIIVFKYKAKTRYRRKKGHRQKMTRVSIREIVA